MKIKLELELDTADQDSMEQLEEFLNNIIDLIEEKR